MKAQQAQMTSTRDVKLARILGLVPQISKRYSAYTAKTKFCDMLRDIRAGEFSPCAKITAEKIVSCQRRKAQLAIDRHSRRGVEIKEHQFPVSLEDVVETASSLHAHIDEKGLLRMTEEEEKGGGKGSHDRGMLFHRDHHLVLRLACLVLHAGLWVVPDQDMTRVQWDEERASLVVEGEPLRASPYRSRIPFDFQRVIDTLQRNSGECSFLLTADKANPMSDLALQHTLRKAFQGRIEGVTARRLENAFWGEVVIDDLVLRVCPPGDVTHQ